MEAIPKSDIKSVIKSDIRFDISIKRTTWIGHICWYVMQRLTHISPSCCSIAGNMEWWAKHNRRSFSFLRIAKRFLLNICMSVLSLADNFYSECVRTSCCVTVCMCKWLSGLEIYFDQTKIFTSSPVVAVSEKNLVQK